MRDRTRTLSDDNFRTTVARLDRLVADTYWTPALPKR
jgi:hypothetical protein